MMKIGGPQLTLLASNEVKRRSTLVQDFLRKHHISVLVETHTDDLDRLMRHLHGTHKLVHQLDVPDGCAGRKGHEVAMIASNACVQFWSVFRVAPDIQCMWIKCRKELFGLNREVLRLVLNTLTLKEGCFLCPKFVNSSLTNLMSLRVLHRICEVSDAHYGAFVDCPALQTARRCECSDVNVAGRLLVDIAAAYGLVFTTGRVHGDVGQPTFVGCRSDIRPNRWSRPDNVLISPSLFKCALKPDICASILDTTDHGSIAVVFRVPDVVPNADWTPSPEHVCGMGRCASKLSLTWRHERQLTYVEELERNLEMLVQLEDALEAGNIDTASTHTHGMGSCPESTHYQEAALHTTGPVGMHPTCPAGSVPHIPYQKTCPMGSCLKALLAEDTDCGTALAEGWSLFLELCAGWHSGSLLAGLVTKELQLGKWQYLWGVTTRLMGSFFCQGAESRLMPKPDEMELPHAAALYPLVCEHMRKLNARTSPGFDAIAVPFIKSTEKRVLAVNGRGTDNINVLAPYIALAKINPLYKKGSVLDPENCRMLAISGTLYRLHASVLGEVVSRWCQKNEISDTQFGFYPGRNTLQPMFILRHLQHAAQIKLPNASLRLHAAFINK
eukprot:1148714-Pelagomonas_calceolata.AAC.1